LLADPDRAAAMGAAGREWAVAHWQWDALAARLSELVRG
jgi:phosphatidylinositol alpha-1,6-mannosyltransferase